MSRVASAIWVFIFIWLGITAGHAKCPVSTNASYKPPENLINSLESVFARYMKCNPKPNQQTPCNWFAADALKSVYGQGDFYANGTPLLADAIYKKLKGELKVKWVEMSDLTRNEHAECAQALASSGYPVIAAMPVPPGEVNGHICLVIPGDLKTSTAWEAWSPNSACYRLNAGDFWNKPLSTTFGKVNAQKASYFYPKGPL